MTLVVNSEFHGSVTPQRPEFIGQYTLTDSENSLRVNCGFKPSSVEMIGIIPTIGNRYVKFILMNQESSTLIPFQLDTTTGDNTGSNASVKNVSDDESTGFIMSNMLDGSYIVTAAR